MWRFSRIAAKCTGFGGPLRGVDACKSLWVSSLRGVAFCGTTFALEEADKRKLYHPIIAHPS